MGVTEESHRIGWGLAALALLFLCAAFVPHQALADGNRSLLSGEVRIHVLPFSYNDAIIIECDGHFGVVDSGRMMTIPTGQTLAILHVTAQLSVVVTKTRSLPI